MSFFVIVNFVFVRSTSRSYPLWQFVPFQKSFARMTTYPPNNVTI